MDLGLKGRRALITGGTKSIGRSIVDAFAEGAVVGFCARDAKLVRQREEEWKAKQARVEGTALDVTNDSILTKWIDGFAAQGGIDHCVANLSALGTDDTPEGWRKSIEIDMREIGEAKTIERPATPVPPAPPPPVLYKGISLKLEPSMADPGRVMPTMRFALCAWATARLWRHASTRRGSQPNAASWFGALAETGCGYRPCPRHRALCARAGAR